MLNGKGDHDYGIQDQGGKSQVFGDNASRVDNSAPYASLCM